MRFRQTVSILLLVLSYGTMVRAQSSDIDTDLARSLDVYQLCGDHTPTFLDEWCANAASRLTATTGVTITEGPSGGDIGPPPNCAVITIAGFCPSNSCLDFRQCSLVWSIYPSPEACGRFASSTVTSDKGSHWADARAQCGLPPCPNEQYWGDQGVCKYPPYPVAKATAQHSAYLPWRVPGGLEAQQRATLFDVKLLFGSAFTNTATQVPKDWTVEQVAQLTIADRVNWLDWQYRQIAEGPISTEARRVEDAITAIVVKGAAGNLWTDVGACETCIPCPPSNCPICPDPPTCPFGLECLPPLNCDRDCPSVPPNGNMLFSLNYTSTVEKPDAYKAEKYDERVALGTIRYVFTVSIPPTDNRDDAKGWRSFLYSVSAPLKKAWKKGKVMVYVQFGPDGQIRVKSGNGTKDADSWPSQDRTVIGWKPVNGGEVSARFEVGNGKVIGTVTVSGHAPVHFDYDAFPPTSVKELGALLGNSKPKDSSGRDQVHWSGITTRLEVREIE